jgi:hypothetical protein
MSIEDNRATALELALTHFQIGEGSILDQAARYADFIAGVSVPATQPSKAGRKAKGEVNGEAVKPASAAVDNTSTGATTTAASVATETAAATPKQVGTKEAMKAAVLAYRDATSQDEAMKLLTAVGAENWGTVPPHLFQQVTDSAVAALAALQKPAAKTLDPFGDDDETPAAPALVLADVKKAFVARQKEVSEAALLGVLTSLGAVGAGAPGQPLTPSLKHLDSSKFAAAIAAVNALPKTK